tara:strand:+ start:12736 stop:13917 length:1182 start_codon:yes stop_codon:yes gene_type:complete
MTAAILEQNILKVSNSLPDLPQRPRKNMFDILGVQNKETINSRILAYFLDPNEDHGFGTLFFDSLLCLLIDIKGKDWNSNDYSGEFQVSTEDTTYYSEEEDQQQKRIDITIKGEDWCIIIENKLYHFLKNPLKSYWQHAKKTSLNVTGVVLSLKAMMEDECREHDVSFINITHKSWLDQIQKSLILADIDNDTDIIYLREYIKTIESHYQYMKHRPTHNALVQGFINQKDAIASIEKKKKEATDFIDRQIEEVFEAHGYIKVKQWYCHSNDHNLCFSLNPSSEILRTNSMRFAYEVYNDLKTSLGVGIKKVHDALKILDLGTDFYFDDRYNKPNMSRIITYRNYDFIHEGTDFKVKFDEILDTYFFNPGGIVETAIELFPEAIAQVLNQERAE